MIVHLWTKLLAPSRTSCWVAFLFLCALIKLRLENEVSFTAKAMAWLSKSIATNGRALPSSKWSVEYNCLGRGQTLGGIFTGSKDANFNFSVYDLRHWPIHARWILNCIYAEQSVSRFCLFGMPHFILLLPLFFGGWGWGGEGRGNTSGMHKKVGWDHFAICSP